MSLTRLQQLKIAKIKSTFPECRKCLCVTCEGTGKYSNCFRKTNVCKIQWYNKDNETKKCWSKVNKCNSYSDWIADITNSRGY